MKNIWLEVDEPRKHFFKTAYDVLSGISHFVRLGKMDELYSAYETFVKAYKRLHVTLKLYDQNVIAVFEGVEAALDLYCHGNRRFDEIYVTA